MRLWSRLRSWSRANMGRSRMESEMDAELKFHMEAYANDLVRGGMPREEAMRRARLEFGGIERAKEECGDSTGVTFVESIAQDIRYGLRMLRKSPSFAVAAVATLALAIGANTVAFAALNALDLRWICLRSQTGGYHMQHLAANVQLVGRPGRSAVVNPFSGAGNVIGKEIAYAVMGTGVRN
jgi:hypothetical protein